MGAVGRLSSWNLRKQIIFFALQLASSKSNPSSTNEGTMDPTCVPPPNHHLHVPRNELEPVMKLQLYKNKVCGCSWIELLITVETIKFVVPINGSYALLTFVKFRVSCRVTKGLCRMRFRSSSHLPRLERAIICHNNTTLAGWWYTYSEKYELVGMMKFPIYGKS